MIDLNKCEIILNRGWILRIQRPQVRQNERLLVSIHGWTGDENSTAVFHRELPDNYWIISPRGPIQTGESGFGWIARRPGRDAALQEFLQPATQLAEMVNRWRKDYGIGDIPLDLLGFSQGGAIAITYALMFPEDVKKIAILAGFLPGQPVNYQPSPAFSKVQCFIAHGTRDELITIDRAHEMVARLRSFGASIDYCQSDVGHRISANCYRKLNEFFN